MLHSILGISQFLHFLKKLHTVRYTVCAVTFFGIQQMCNVSYSPLWRHTEQFHCPKKKNPMSFTYPPLLIPPELLATTDLFTVSTLCLFWNVV